MNRTSNKVVEYILDMCTKTTERYAEDIKQCDEIGRLTVINLRAANDFGNLSAVAQCLPRRPRKLCLALISAVRDEVAHANLGKGLQIMRKNIEKRQIWGGRESNLSDETAGALFEMLRKSGAKVGFAHVKVKKCEKEDTCPEAKKTEGEPAPDPASSAESPRGKEQSFVIIDDIDPDEKSRKE